MKDIVNSEDHEYALKITEDTATRICGEFNLMVRRTDPIYPVEGSPDAAAKIIFPVSRLSGSYIDPEEFDNCLGDIEDSVWDKCAGWQLLVEVSGEIYEKDHNRAHITIKVAVPEALPASETDFADKQITLEGGMFTVGSEFYNGPHMYRVVSFDAENSPTPVEFLRILDGEAFSASVDAVNGLVRGVGSVLN